MNEDHRKSTKIMKPMKFPDVDDILPHVPSLLISSALPVHLLRQVSKKLKKPMKKKPSVFQLFLKPKRNLS